MYFKKVWFYLKFFRYLAGGIFRNWRVLEDVRFRKQKGEYFKSPKEQAKYDKAVFGWFLDTLNKYGGIKGKKIVEIGPGGSLGIGVLCVKEGARQYIGLDAVDRMPSYENMKKTFDCIIPGGKKTVPEWLKQGKIKKLIANEKSGYSLEDDSVDIIFSCAVLEHIEDVEMGIKEMCRILKKGGLMNHQVDLRDHAIDAKSKEFLKIDKKWFDLAFRGSGVYINRLRFGDFKRYFKKYGLRIEWVYINERFSGKETDENVAAFNILLRKVK